MGKFNFAKKLTQQLARSYDVYNWIEVSRSALLHNCGFFEEHANLQIIPVLKGNAYGHGIHEVMEALSVKGLQYVAVDGYFEALKVHETNKHQNVLVMGMIKASNIPRLRLKGLSFVVHDPDSINAFGRLNKRIKLHLEINTGMNRCGISPSEVDKYLKLFKKFPKLELEGVMSHLADADGDDFNTVDDAVKIFDNCVENIKSQGFLPTIIHISQSAGSLRAKSKYANSMRLGIGMYGINPYPKDHKFHRVCKNLRPALCLKSTIIEVQKLKKGEKVSYNYTYTASSPISVGVLPLGYHEGVNRALSNVGVVKVNTKYTPIIGRVCMNHTMIKVDSLHAKPGTPVTVISNNTEDENSVESIADTHNLFTYNLLTNLSPDVRRILVE